MTPDRNIVKRLKAYDRNLFIRWNASRQFFELWMKRPLCSQSVLITPITKAIYDPKAKVEFCDVDERLLWWVWAADSHRWGGSKKHAIASDSRFLEMMEKMDGKHLSTYRDMAKDAWQMANAFYGSSSKKKNGKPKFLPKPQERKFVPPDIKLKATKSSYARSSWNAKAYNYQRKSR